MPRLLLGLVVLCLYNPTLSDAQSSTSQATASVQQTNAVSILKQSLSAMGSVPSDSSAFAMVTVTAGPDQQQGSLTISTKGLNQSFEQLTIQGTSKSFIYSNGFANDSEHLASSPNLLYSAERAASAQSSLFPLPLLAAILSYADAGFEYIALENVAGKDYHHIRTYRTFATEPDLAYLSPFTVRDIWIDSGTYLPAKIKYSEKEGQGATPTTEVQVVYSNYRQVTGVQYPFGIVKSLNGTPWMAVSVSSVSINSGTSDSVFSLH